MEAWQMLEARVEQLNNVRTDANASAGPYMHTHAAT